MSKTVVSVAEMARMVGLSRARFYQLVGEGIFPSPLYSVHTRRPFFSEEMQAICLEVRRQTDLVLCSKTPLWSAVEASEEAEGRTETEESVRRSA
jgi:hypothetical protein